MPVGVGWGGGFPTEGGTLVGPLTIDTGTAPAFEIDSSATSGTLVRINFDGATTQAGAYIGLDIDLTTNLTDNDTAITGLRIQTDSTAAAAAAGQGALVINSDATLARVLDIDVANTAGTIGYIRYGASATLSSTLIGLDLDLQTNVASTAQLVDGLIVRIGASSSGSTRGILVRSTQTGGSFIEGNFSGASTWGGQVTGLNLDLSTNVTPGSNSYRGVYVLIPASTAASAANQGALVIDCNATVGRVLDIDVANTSGTLGIIRYGAAVTFATAATIGLNIDQSTNVTNAAQTVSAYATTQLLSSTGRTSMLAGTGNNAQTCNFGWWSENLTLSVAGATTNTTNTIPADSFILAVDAYITAEITGVDSTAVQIGDATTAARFASLVALTVGTVDVGLTHLEAAINSATTGAIVRAATSVRVTLSGGADNTPTAGAVRITVRYITFGAATS